VSGVEVSSAKVAREMQVAHKSKEEEQQHVAQKLTNNQRWEKVQLGSLSLGFHFHH
jgi:hypothetical protein